MPKCRLTFDLITYANYDILVEQTGEPQLTVSKDGEELRLTFIGGHYRAYQQRCSNNVAYDQNGRSVYVSSLSRLSPLKTSIELNIVFMV